LEWLELFLAQGKRIVTMDNRGSDIRFRRDRCVQK
jgi:hypothetical protein